jgi:hypothetical protein
MKLPLLEVVLIQKGKRKTFSDQHFHKQKHTLLLPTMTADGQAMGVSEGSHTFTTTFFGCNVQEVRHETGVAAPISAGSVIKSNRSTTGHMALSLA